MASLAGYYNVNYGKDMAVVRTPAQWGWLIFLLVALVILPMVASRQYLFLAIDVFGTIIAVHGLNILIGYAGLISLGHVALVAVGGYTSAILCTKLGVSFWIAFPLAGVSAGLVGLLIGLPALRIKGFYLAAITLAAHFVVMFFIITFYGLTGGVYGIAAPAPTLGDLFAIDTPERYYYLAFLSAVLSTFFAKNLARTKPGRAFVAIRDNDIAAEVMGIDLFQYKALAFFVGSVFAGLSGSLLAHSVGWISPEDFPLMRSVWMVGMLIVGGMGHCLGAILGVVFIKGIDQIATALIPIIGRIFPNVMISLPVALGQIFFALAIMFFLVFEPRGLAHRWESIKASYRIWPFRH